MDQRILMAPSILSADFARLEEAVRMISEGGADFVHVDVMDGHFVPNLTIGPPVVKAIKRITDTPLDVHLMITNAEATVDQYLSAGADWVTVHAEACIHLDRALQVIKTHGARAGVSLNPATNVESIRDVIGSVDMVLLMSVNPGFGGQKFISRTIDKLTALSKMCAEEGVAPLIQVDGGIDLNTAPLAASAGARCLVAGNAVFCQDDPVAAMNAIREAAQAAI